MSTDQPDENLSLETSFVRVDDQPDPSLLVETMDQTSQWPAIIALRAFEAERLALAPGDRALDVGCGRGEVACSMAARVGPTGRVVGVDASEAMLANARARAAAAAVEVEFRLGDCLALDEADGSFDAVRAERVLQWIADDQAAVAELVRVLRPGGHLGLIDTDWRTLAIDLPDHDAADAVARAMVATRGLPAAIGGRLVNLCRAAGLLHVEVLPQTHVWTQWDPDVEVAPSGFFPLDEVTPQFVDAGVLTAEQSQTFVDQARAAGREGRLFMSLTMFAVTARKPS
jgi:SAM-dependent methyltransferase